MRGLAFDNQADLKEYFDGAGDVDKILPIRDHDCKFAGSAFVLYTDSASGKATA